jgi:hypothetical protein
MKKVILMAIAGFILRGPAIAQINESDTSKWQIKTSLSGNYQTGNVVFLNIRSKFDVLFSPNRRWVFKSQNNSLYQSFYDKKADNDVFSKNYVYYKPQNNFYTYAMSFVSANYRRKIDARYFVGLGETWQIVNNRQHFVKFSLSAVYEQTTFSEAVFNAAEYNGSNKINVWRGTAYIAGGHQLFDKHLYVFYDAYWQPAFDNSTNYRMQYDIGFNFPLWKGLAVNVLYAFSQENVVVQKIKTNDAVLTFGFSYAMKVNHKTEIGNGAKSR